MQRMVWPRCQPFARCYKHAQGIDGFHHHSVYACVMMPACFTPYIRDWQALPDVAACQPAVVLAVLGVRRVHVRCCMADGGGGVLVAWGARGASQLWQCVVAYLAVSSALWIALHLRAGGGGVAQPFG